MKCYIVLVVVVFGLAPATTADLFKVCFQGVVKRISGSDVLHGSVANELTGSCTFDTAQPPECLEPGLGAYHFTSPKQRIIVNIRAYLSCQARMGAP